MQVCYVVDDVAAAVDFCQQQFGWGPFNQFTAEVESAQYRDWQGSKRVDVALGMAGKVQIELMHIHQGEDPVATFQSRFGRGVQHIGIHCSDRDKCIRYLESRGAVINEVNEYPGIEFAFMDIPDGEALFELVSPTQDFGASVVSGGGASSTSQDSDKTTLLPVNRVTIATEDIAALSEFYASVFGWKQINIDDTLLAIEGDEMPVKRSLQRAGTLEFEFIQPGHHAACPYRQHLNAGRGGVVHAACRSNSASMRNTNKSLDKNFDKIITGEWLASGERFQLLSWAGGEHSLQFIYP